MFKDAIGTGKKDDLLKSLLFGLGVLAIKISVAGIIIFGITYVSDKLNPKPSSIPARYQMKTKGAL
jgi:hypothetical protein